jgi:elongator complex protein 3
MLSYGVTGVEIGVQTIYPEILRLINRGHTIEDVIKANEIARNAGLKIGFHVMPCLPGSNFEMDLNMFKEIFENPNFRPDYLKIYPTLVIKNTKLYEMWKRGEYKAWELEEVVDLIARIKKFIPPYCRIQRIGRALSAKEIVAGYKKTNLREIVRKRAKELGINCKCIRCREVGFKIMQNIFPEKAEVCRMDYEANGGREIFLSFEDKKNDILFAFLRLRIPNKSHRKEITDDVAIIRELKVVGHHVGIGNEPGGFQFQHRGFGRALLKKAEEIAKEEFGKNKILILSGVGAREYYRKFGYRLEGPYMVKNL